MRKLKEQQDEKLAFKDVIWRRDCKNMRCSRLGTWLWSGRGLRCVHEAIEPTGKAKFRRFSEDLIFQLNAKEWAHLTSQIAISNAQSNRSQFATASQSGGVKELTARLDVHETAITEMLRQIKRLLSPPSEIEPPKKRIGFLVEEPRVPYKSSKRSRVEKRYKKKRLLTESRWKTNSRNRAAKTVSIFWTIEL